MHKDTSELQSEIAYNKEQADFCSNRLSKFSVLNLKIAAPCVMMSIQWVWVQKILVINIWDSLLEVLCLSNLTLITTCSH